MRKSSKPSLRFFHSEELRAKTIALLAALEQAERLLGMVTESFESRETLISQLSPVLGVHSGPGMVGVNFFPVPAASPPGETFST
jgi:fatty acid-binding protein DegV